MSAVPFKVTQANVNPPYQAGLLDGDGNPPDLTGATVVFRLQRIGDTAFTVEAAAEIVGNPANGEVIYHWTSPDVSSVGMFMASWQVTFPDTSVIIYPSETVDLVEIVPGPNLGYSLRGPCAPWTTVQAVRACCSGLPASGHSGYVSDTVIQANINVASDLLYTLSAQQFTGECVSILRPCKTESCFGQGPRFDNLSSIPLYTDPDAFPREMCGCGRKRRVDLGLWPITNIVYVKVDGELLDPATYRLDENRWLVRMDGPGPDYINPGWPVCQRLNRPATEVGTFEVMVEFGVPVPAAGANAAAKLACELTKASAGLACQLPGRVQSANRQQLSFTMINASMLDNGLTGLYEVDLFIMAYNASKSRGQTFIWSPDLPRGGYRAGG